MMSAEGAREADPPGGDAAFCADAPNIRDDIDDAADAGAGGGAEWASKAEPP